jgi:hypothetical protein
MKPDRIYFNDNPWPEGHPIKEFAWSAKEVNGEVWFDLHLKSADYYSEREIEDDENTEYPSDWAAPIVWGNYHSCILSSSYWSNEGFRVCAKADYTPELLDGLELTIDPDPEALEDFEDRFISICWDMTQWPNIRSGSTALVKPRSSDLLERQDRPGLHRGLRVQTRIFACGFKRRFSSSRRLTARHLEMSMVSLRESAGNY